MLSVTSLRNAINQQLSNAASKRKLAESLMTSASEHEARGDYANAQRDRNSAERYMRDMHGIENTIVKYETEIQQRQLKARDIDKQITDLQQRYEYNLKQLEKEKDKFTILTAPEIEIEHKVRDIDNKIAELEKQHHHELERLEREKNDLVG